MKLLTLIPPRRYQTRERIQAGLLLLGTIVVAVTLYRETPGEPLQTIPPCPFHTLTGLFCPGCGSGRALVNLFHGRFYAAWRLNPLAMLLLPVPLCFLLNLFTAVLTGRSLPGAALPARAVWALPGVIMAYFILRNIPLYPFTLLQPHLLP